LSGLIFSAQAAEADLTFLSDQKVSAGYLNYPADTREPRRAVGSSKTRHLNDLAESIDVNAGDCPCRGQQSAEEAGAESEVP
jgi:hypothetical protein